MKKNKDNIYKTYEKIASWMDENRSRTLFEKPYLDKVITYLKPNARILDLGCGTGEPIGQYFVDSGFDVTGVDGSSKMLEIAKERCPKINFILSDMRDIQLNQTFDCIIAWHSFFHLTQESQRKMFEIFALHLNKKGILLFSSGPEAGEVWSENGGELLYHASLSSEEYESILNKNEFTLIEHKVSDPECGGATVWLAQYRN